MFGKLWLKDSGLVGSTDFHGRSAATAEDARETPIQSHISPSILVHEDQIRNQLSCLSIKATWKREFKLSWRKAGLLISMIQWTRTSRLSIKISLSLSLPFDGVQRAHEPTSLKNLSDTM